MKTKVVKKYRMPAYPDKTAVNLNRTLIANQPNSWHKEPLVRLAFIILAGSGLLACKKNPLPYNKYGQLDGDIAAPLQISGISDEDALAIIADELKNAGYLLELPGNEFDFIYDAVIKKDGENINLEFVSLNDISQEKYPQAKDIDVYSLYTKDVAKALEKNYRDGAFFYAPDDYEVEEQLRIQVNDFLIWLNSQQD